MVAGGKQVDFGAGAAIGCGGQQDYVSGNEVKPYTSGLYDTGCIIYYAAGTKVTDIKNGTVPPSVTIEGIIIVNKTLRSKCTVFKCPSFILRNIIRKGFVIKYKNGLMYIKYNLVFLTIPAVVILLPIY